jgi:hypothetical protein
MTKVTFQELPKEETPEDIIIETTPTSTTQPPRATHSKRGYSTSSEIRAIVRKEVAKWSPSHKCEIEMHIHHFKHQAEYKWELLTTYTVHPKVTLRSIISTSAHNMTQSKERLSPYFY